uniref:CUB domain-containing protein n=1 Tax=Setaria digitata TaxID=48799 RepID=A0A915Q2I6_9BILA
MVEWKYLMWNAAAALFRDIRIRSHETIQYSTSTAPFSANRQQDPHFTAKRSTLVVVVGKVEAYTTYAIGTGANRLDVCRCRSVTFGIDITAGELKSPGYPASYCNNLNCKYEIDAVWGQSIHLSIVSFETEPRHDFLEIHQTFVYANTQYSARITTLSGKNIAWPSFASAVSGGFILKFVTDANSCPTFFHEATGENKALSSPPINFMYFAGCTYMLNTSEGYGIKLNLRSLAPMVKFTIYETENFQVPMDQTVSPLSEIVGLTSAVPKEIISRTNSMLIQVTIEKREFLLATASNKFLFEAQFSRTDSLDRAAVLSSPGFPLEYCDKLDCETELVLDQYTVDSTHHNAILMEIHSFSLEHGSDFVHFLDRLKHSSRHLISRTGELSTSRNKFFTFNGERAVLRMITDSTVTNQGFNMTGEAQPLEVSSSAGMFSFNSPADCSFLDCFFQFNRPVNALDSDRIRLVINITYTFKNGEEEFLEVLSNINNYNIIPSHLNERDITVFDPALAQSGIEEVTNDTPLMIWYHLASDINKQAAQFDFSYKWKPICECGYLGLEAKDGEWKQLTSPDYPSHYCNLMKCQYLITAPQGYIVVVNITELALEPNEDLLVIFDGANITNKRIKITSGVEIFTDLLRSSTEVMTVYFETDISITNKGFVLYYTAALRFFPRKGPPGKIAEYLSRNDKNKVTGKLEGFKHLGIVFCLLFFVTGAVFGLTYYKRLFCFANRRGHWHGTSVGFTNLSHESSNDWAFH